MRTLGSHIYIYIYVWSSSYGLAQVLFFWEISKPKQIPISFTGILEVYDIIALIRTWDHQIISYFDPLGLPPDLPKAFN